MELHFTIDAQTARVFSDMAQQKSVGLEQCVHQFLLDALEKWEDEADLRIIAERDKPGASRVSNEDAWK